MFYSKEKLLKIFFEYLSTLELNDSQKEDDNIEINLGNSFKKALGFSFIFIGILLLSLGYKSKEVNVEKLNEEEDNNTCINSNKIGHDSIKKDQ